MSSFATEPVVSSVPETWGVQDNDYTISVRPLLASTDSAYGLELANDSSEHSGMGMGDVFSRCLYR